MYTGYGTRAVSIPPRLERPDVQSVEEVVTNALREAILSGELRPGDRLLQEQLAEQLRVSRIPLRDALRRLEAEGLVRIGPRRGAEVTSLTPSDVKEIYDLRIKLETELLEAAIAALTGICVIGVLTTFDAPVMTVLTFGFFRHQAMESWARVQSSRSAIFPSS